jgi:hypothetical protein
MSKDKTIPFTLTAPNGQKLDGRIEITGTMLSIGFKGYGEHGARKNRGTPILIEFHEIDGALAPQVHVFGDINKDELTHTFSLARAAESKRLKTPMGA